MYYHNTLETETGISGDDLNRRHRESRLGYSEPSADWAQARHEIRCIFPGQIIHRKALDNVDIHVHSDEAYFEPLDSDGNSIMTPIRVIK